MLKPIVFILPSEGDWDQPVTLVHRTLGAPNAATLRPAAVTETNDGTTGVVRSFSHRQVDGVNVRATDRRVLLEPTALTSAPDPDDHLILDATGERVAILNVRAFSPSGSVCAYDCHVRALKA